MGRADRLRRGAGVGGLRDEFGELLHACSADPTGRAAPPSRARPWSVRFSPRRAKCVIAEGYEGGGRGTSNAAMISRCAASSVTSRAACSVRCAAHRTAGVTRRGVPAPRGGLRRPPGNPAPSAGKPLRPRAAVLLALTPGLRCARSRRRRAVAGRAESASELEAGFGTVEELFADRARARRASPGRRSLEHHQMILLIGALHSMELPSIWVIA